MKTQFTKIFAIAFIITIILLNIYGNRNTRNYADIILTNIDALANDEVSGTGQYTVLSDTTKSYEDGVLYKESVVRNCLQGGSYSCTSGNSYRHKNSDGTWGEWTPA